LPARNPHCLHPGCTQIYTALINAISLGLVGTSNMSGRVARNSTWMYGARFSTGFALDDVIELHAFVPLEARPSV
jgi:hypothetical protein